MEKLSRWAGLAAVLALVSCATPPPAPVLSEAAAEPLVVEALPPLPDSARWIDGRLRGALAAGAGDPLPMVSSFDLEAWSFGWVEDAESAAALGLNLRFWSDQKPRWKEALAPQTKAPRAAKLLELVHRSGSVDETARAAWLLFRLYSRASLPDQARFWLDRANDLRPTPATALEKAWDQAFRLSDVMGARALWVPVDRWPDPDRERKARLVRQKLFGGSFSPASVGADNFLSTQILDRDDLWAGTWNGAVVRWSLATERMDLILPAGTTVSPVKLLVATGWFLYAFQDQSLLRYSKVTGDWRSFSYPPGWTGLRVQAAVAQGEEALWVANLGQGLWRWSQGQWTLIDDGGGGGGPFLNALVSDGQGGFLVGTKDRGLWRWKDGLWTAIFATEGRSPVNISVLEPNDNGRWFVGTWGEGTWVLDQGLLSRWSEVPDYVTAAAWDGEAPLWGALDQGIVQGRGESRQVLGPRDGIPAGGISGLVTWQGRWIWGTTGQGWGWWSEHENPALLR